MLLYLFLYVLNLSILLLVYTISALNIFSGYSMWVEKSVIVILIVSTILLILACNKAYKEKKLQVDEVTENIQ